MQSILQTATAFVEALAGFEPDSLSGPEAAHVAGALIEAEKVCGAARARAVARVEACGAHVSAGCRSGAEWLAKKAGTTLGQASAALETVRMVETLPATKAAFVSGQLSELQAHVVAKAAAADPSAEASLLDTATNRDLRSLRDQARRVRLAAEKDVEALHQRQHRLREFCHWVDDDGVVAGRFRLPPEVGTPIVNRIDAQADREFRNAYREGRREPRAAYCADALVSLLEGTAGGHSGRADLVVVVDLPALRRGHVHGQERCHIPGVGPVPVSLAQEMTPDAFVKGVLVDGCDIKKVKHFGRHIRAEVRTALELGPAPALDGISCVEEGCGRKAGLELDHVDPAANWGPTAYGNLQPRCRPHHKEKTERDRKAGLLQGRAPP